MYFGVKYMKDYISERAVNIGKYMVEHRLTVRSAAKKFGISKSTVHKDISERLIKINPTLAMEAKKLLDINKAERHIRGGIATKNKYKTTCWNLLDYMLL